MRYMKLLAWKYRTTTLALIAAIAILAALLALSPSSAQGASGVWKRCRRPLGMPLRCAESAFSRLASPARQL